MPSRIHAPSCPDPFTLVRPELREALGALTARDPDFLTGAEESISPEVLAKVLPDLRSAWAADTSHVPARARKPEVSEYMVPGHEGAPDVRILLIHSHSDGRRPAILHMHGGGFIVGTAEEYVPVLQAQAMALDCVIASVDYRLAPETPYPGALEDGYAALKWLHAHCDQLGIDPTRIAVQGESAGGGLAAMLAIAARDRAEVPILFQCLTYPMLDDRTGSSRNVPGHIGTFCWTAKYNRMGWSAFLGMPAGGPSTPAGAVPGRVGDLAGLPAAFIWVGSIDLFVEENLEYARRLVNAGVPVELHVVPGVYHGFDGAAPGAAVTIDYRMAVIRALARAFGIVPHRATRSFFVPDEMEALVER